MIHLTDFVCLPESKDCGTKMNVLMGMNNILGRQYVNKEEWENEIAKDQRLMEEYSHELQRYKNTFKTADHKDYQKTDAYLAGYVRGIMRGRGSLDVYQHHDRKYRRHPKSVGVTDYTLGYYAGKKKGQEMAIEDEKFFAGLEEEALANIEEANLVDQETKKSKKNPNNSKKGKNKISESNSKSTNRFQKVTVNSIIFITCST